MATSQGADERAFPEASNTDFKTMEDTEVGILSGLSHLNVGDIKLLP